MTYCTNCHTLEGSVKTVVIDGEEYEVCAECGSEDGLTNVPEHDDYDMER